MTGLVDDYRDHRRYMEPRLIVIYPCSTSLSYSRNRQPHHCHTLVTDSHINTHVQLKLYGLRKYLAGDFQTRPLRKKHPSTCILHPMLLVGEYPCVSCFQACVEMKDTIQRGRSTMPTANSKLKINRLAVSAI